MKRNRPDKWIVKGGISESQKAPVAEKQAVAVKPPSSFVEIVSKASAIGALVFVFALMVSESKLTILALVAVLLILPVVTILKKRSWL